MNKKQKVFISIVGVVLLIGILGTVFYLIVNSNSRQYEKHLTQAQKYIDELEYEEALAELELAIDIAPNDERAYLRMADIYMAKDDYNNAESILQQGMDTIGKDNLSEEFLNKLISIWEMLEDNTDLAEV